MLYVAHLMLFLFRFGLVLERCAGGRFCGVSSIPSRRIGVWLTCLLTPCVGSHAISDLAAVVGSSEGVVYGSIEEGESELATLWSGSWQWERLTVSRGPFRP